MFFSGLAVSRDSTWVIGDPNEPSLWRIDAGTGRLAQTIRLPYAPRDVAVGAGGVWVTSRSPTGSSASTREWPDPADVPTAAALQASPSGQGPSGWRTQSTTP